MTNPKKTPREWYKSKAFLYNKATGQEWSFVEPYSDHPMSSYCYETLQRIGIEKRYFGLTTLQEDVEIANAVMIRDLL